MRKENPEITDMLYSELAAALEFLAKSLRVYFDDPEDRNAQIDYEISIDEIIRIRDLITKHGYFLKKNKKGFSTGKLVMIKERRTIPRCSKCGRHINVSRKKPVEKCDCILHLDRKAKEISAMWHD